MASDMHFGKLSGVSHLKRLVRHVNEMEPDIILLPGDIIDDHPGVFIQKYGTYYETNDSSIRRIWCVRKPRILRASSS